jgi:cytochrome c5
MGKLLLGLGAVFLGAACATTGPVPAEPAPPAAGAPDGRTLYEESCQRCHALYMPRSYTASEWRFFVRKYGRKARLSAEEREKVYAYLAENAAS